MGVEERSAAEARALARELAHEHRERAVAAAVGRAGTARADALAADAGVPVAAGRLPRGPARVRYGWRKAVRLAVERRMLTPEHLGYYARYLAWRLRRPHVELQGMVFFGPGVDLTARRHFGRLVIGPWCWLGARTSLRAHEGNLRLAPKVVLGRDNAVNCYLDIELGWGALLSDRIYICDFDHNYDRPDVPIRKQGIATTPVRVGEDVWVGEKASILRGADIGAGSVIGSQTVVKDRIPPFSIVVGAPGRVIGSRLPEGMTAEEALALQRQGAAIPGDPLEG